MLAALQLLFVGCNVLANCLPRDMIAAHAEESLSSPLITNEFAYDHRVLGGPICFDNNRFIVEIARQKDQGSPYRTMALAEIDDVTKGGGIAHQQYFRYWHGWQLLTNFCLLVGNIDVVIFPAAALAIVGGIFAYLALRKRFSRGIALGFLAILLLSTNLLLNCVGDLLLCISFFTALLLMSCMSLHLSAVTDRRDYMRALVLWSVANGSVFSFLDFLTIPAAVLTLHCFFAFISLRETADIKCGIVTMLQALVSFGLAFVLTWAVKWIVAGSVLDWSTVSVNVTNEMGLWSSHTSKALLPQADWPQVLQDFYRLSPQLFAICSTAGYAIVSNVICAVSFFVVVVVWAVALVRFVKGRFSLDKEKRAMLSQALLTLLPILVVIAYFVVMHDHAIVHIPVFGCKNWSIVFSVLFASGACALNVMRS